jgi:hypothetical protein
MKVCSKCKVEKDESEFHTCRRDGLQSKCKSCRSEYHKLNRETISKSREEYRIANKDKIAAQNAKYFQENREKCLERMSSYYQANKSKFSKYHKDRCKVDPLYSLICSTRKLVCGSIKAKGYTKNSKTAKLIGCSFEQFMDWLGTKPCDNPHLDHICPMAQAKTEDEANKLQHYMNFQWLTPEENLKKSDNKTYAGEFLCQILLGREWEEPCNNKTPVV